MHLLYNIMHLRAGVFRFILALSEPAIRFYQGEIPLFWDQAYRRGIRRWENASSSSGPWQPWKHSAPSWVTLLWIRPWLLSGRSWPFCPRTLSSGAG